MVTTIELTPAYILCLVICVLFVLAIGVYIGQVLAFKAVEKELKGISTKVNRVVGAAVEIKKIVTDISKKL